MGTSTRTTPDPLRSESATAARARGSERERILVLTSSYPAYVGDASGHFVQAEVNELRAQGHEVIVVAPRPVAQRAHADAPPEPGVRWVEAGSAFGWPGVMARLRERPLRAPGVVRFVLGAWSELNRFGDVDRVLAHFVLPSAYPVLAWSRLRARHVDVVVHGSDARLFARLPAPLRRRITRALASRDVTLRATSHELRVLLEGALDPSFQATIEVAPSPISVAGTPDRARARSLLGFARDVKLVVVVARLIASKRVDVALRAAALLPGARVIAIGDGPLRATLERTFPQVTFAGHLERDRALTHIAAADVVVSASLLEGSPSVVREARLLGTRVVTLRAGDLTERYRADPDVIVVDSAPRAR